MIRVNGRLLKNEKMNLSTIFLLAIATVAALLFTVMWLHIDRAAAVLNSDKASRMPQLARDSQVNNCNCTCNCNFDKDAMCKRQEPCDCESSKAAAAQKQRQRDDTSFPSFLISSESLAKRDLAEDDVRLHPDDEAMFKLHASRLAKECHFKGSAANDTQLLVYNRIGKAGSRTLMSLIEQSRKAAGNSGFAVVAPALSREYLTESAEMEELQKLVGAIQAQRRTKKAVIAIEHIFFIDFARYGLKQPLYFNNMREPVARWMSQFKFWRKLPDIGALVRKTPLETCLQMAAKGAHDTIGCPPLNYQTAYLCGHGPQCEIPPTYSTFEHARKRLFDDYLLVGILERHEETWATLRALLKDSAFKLIASGAKATQSNAAHAADMTDSVRERVARANQWDMRLYRLALRALLAREKACGIA